MKTQLFVGQSSLRGALGKYAKRFNLLEMRAELGRVPRAALLRRWTEEVASKFVFSVMLSRHAGRFDQDYTAALELGLQTVEALNAKWVVIQTDPTVGPSQRSKQRLQGLFAHFLEAGRRVAWEPHGVWQDEDAAAWTRELGVHLVRDISRGEAINEAIIYSRLPGLGTSSRMSAGALENAAASLMHASEAYVVVCGDGAGKAAQLLRGLTTDAAGTDRSMAGAFEIQEVFGAFTDEEDIEEFEDESDDEIDEDAPEVGDEQQNPDETLDNDSERSIRGASKKKREVRRR